MARDDPHSDATGANSADVTVWYDGACPLCVREIALMRRLDRRGRIDFVDIAPETANAACPLGREAMLRRFHARENGRIVQGAEAFAAVWRAIPLLRPLGLAAKIPAVLRALDWLYGRFLGIRPTLQRWLGG